MVRRRVIRKVRDAARIVLVKLLVVLAARVLGPGPTRLRLVKLAHNLGEGGASPPPAVQPTQRAA
jgi:hypothetical protein